MGIGAKLPFNFVHPVRPDDVHNYNQVATLGPALGLRVGKDGDVTVVLPNGVARTFVGVQKGELLRIAHVRVNKTGTELDHDWDHDKDPRDDDHHHHHPTPKVSPLLALWVI